MSGRRRAPRVTIPKLTSPEIAGFVITYGLEVFFFSFYEVIITYKK